MGKALGLNPYLPYWETIPDGEPHVFGDRIYIYGSHDGLRGQTFCEGDYVVWSAPTEDPGNFTCHGVAYQKTQDPINGAAYDGVIPKADLMPGLGENGLHTLFAPDCAKGPDGRYYLYYALDFVGIISVAVAEKPEGPFSFYGYVTYADGSLPTKGELFDPAILSEPGGNYLYYGFAPKDRFFGQEDKDMPGGVAVRLSDDMKTILSEPVLIANGVDTAAGTGFASHPFFEASSIRHIGELYYFVYSSLQGNELCYATAREPLGPYTYRGVIVSNGDIGYQGNALATNYMGNNHGGIASFGGRHYIFYHRQTHGTMFSRQGCAEPIEIAEGGAIAQVPVTSCGLNGGPLPAKGHYEAYIACHLTEKNRANVQNVVNAGPGGTLPEIPAERPYITEEENPAYEKGLKPYVYNLREGSTAGFKFFAFEGTEREIVLELRGSGSIALRLDDPEGKNIGVATAIEDIWKEIRLPLSEAVKGAHALYFTVTAGTLDFAGLTFGQ